MINGPMMKEAIYALNESMKSAGREVNSNNVAEIVSQHALATAGAAAASGVIPGVGGVVALGLASASTAVMYGRLAIEMGVTLKKGVIKALASAVVADIAGTVAVSLAATAAVSFIPVFGNMSAAALNAITNYCFIYLAALIFINVVARLGVSRMATMSEAELKAQARTATKDMDVKAAVKEAKGNYKASK